MRAICLQCAGSTAMSKDVMKLTYFDVRGRVEPYRMIFAHTGVPHEEERVKFDDWPAMKPSKFFSCTPRLVCTTWSVENLLYIICGQC